MARFLPFQKGKNTLFTVEPIAEWNGTVPTEQALSCLKELFQKPSLLLP